MGLALLLLPAVGGYWFLTHCNYTRYQAVRDSGYHVLFRSALCGGFLFLFARVITLLLDYFSPDATGQWNDRFPEPYSSEVALSILLGVLLPLPFNCFYSSRSGARKVARDGGDHIELLISEAIEELKQIEVTLHSRKSYIGFAVESGVGMSGEPDISLIPTMSGFRDKDTQELVIITDYASTVVEYMEESSNLSLEDIRIVIPISEIVSTRFFVPELYERFLEETPDELHDMDVP